MTVPAPAGAGTVDECMPCRHALALHAVVQLRSSAVHPAMNRIHGIDRCVPGPPFRSSQPLRAVLRRKPLHRGGKPLAGVIEMAHHFFLGGCRIPVEDRLKHFPVKWNRGFVLPWIVVGKPDRTQQCGEDHALHGAEDLVVRRPEDRAVKQCIGNHEILDGERILLHPELRFGDCPVLIVRAVVRLPMPRPSAPSCAGCRGVGAGIRDLAQPTDARQAHHRPEVPNCCDA